MTAPAATPVVPGANVRARRSLVPIGTASVVVLVVASLAGLAMFLWPLLYNPEPGIAHVTDAPLSFAVLLPVLAAVSLAELSRGGIDTKALAMLGVLAAVGAALRPVGAGTAGVELVFFLLVLAGRVYGPGFGFVLGSTTMFASALLTGGVGPWMPFQMVAASWIGLGAGLLPKRVRGRAEIAMLACYGVLWSYLYGFILNMWFWPYAIGGDTSLSFIPGDAVSDNLIRFFGFTLATSTWGWDTGRAITNAVAILALGSPVLAVLRRSVRKAAFDAPVAFEPSKD